MDLKNGAPRRFLVLGLDGSVLHERVLPTLAPFKTEADFSNDIYRTYHYSEEGRFLAVLDGPELPSPKVRVYDMASDASWSFDDKFGDLNDDGLLWLTAGTLNSDGSSPAFLRAVSLRTGQELWRAPISGDVEEIGYLGRNKLAALGKDESLTLFEATSGRLFYTLPGQSNFCNALRLLEIRDAGPETFLLCWGVCSLETGRLYPAKLNRFPAADFFSDGRRALRPGDSLPGSSRFPEIVDVETGRTLFAFESSTAPTYSVQARRAGDRVLTATESDAVLLWERRHPEGWKGHFQRPEVLIAIFLGAAILVLWANRPRHDYSSQAS